MNIAGTFLSYVTLGLYFPWFFARLHRYHVQHTLFEGRRFQSSLRGYQVLGFGVVSAFLILSSLGLALPWAMTTWMKLRAHTTAYAYSVDLDGIRDVVAAQGSALAEGVGEAGEALSELGEFFGG